MKAMMKSSLFPGFVLCLILAGCVPGIRGTTQAFPLDIDFRDPSSQIEVTAGRTFFVSNTGFYVRPGFFGYTNAEANSLLVGLNRRRPRVGDTVTKSVTREFSIRDVQAPEDWTVRLYRVEAKREVTDVDNRNDIFYFDDNIHLFFSIIIPEGERPGVYTIRVTVEGKNETSDQIAFWVRVLDPEEPRETLGVIEQLDEAVEDSGVTDQFLVYQQSQSEKDQTRAGDRNRGT